MLKRSSLAAVLLVAGLALSVPSYGSTGAPQRVLSDSGRSESTQAHARAVHLAHLRHAHALRHAAAVIGSVVAVGYRVSVCEEGGRWHFVGSTYDGGLGFLLATWQQFKRPVDPYWMHDASPYEQSRALFALVAHYGIAMPDQAGCTGGY